MLFAAVDAANSNPITIRIGDISHIFCAKVERRGFPASLS